MTYGIYAPSGSSSISSDQVVNSMVIYQSMLTQSFSVDRSTGAVTLRRALSRDLPFGFNRWQMNVVAADEAGRRTSRSSYSVVTVQLTDINDHAPVFDACCLHGSVPESSAPGKVSTSLVLFLPSFVFLAAVNLVNWVSSLSGCRSDDTINIILITTQCPQKTAPLLFFQ